MSAAVMFRGKLQIDLRNFTVGGFIFDPQIRQRTLAFDYL
jgi:hypothetical protein